MGLQLLGSASVLFQSRVVSSLCWVGFVIWFGGARRIFLIAFGMLFVVVIKLICAGRKRVVLFKMFRRIVSLRF